VHIDDARLLLRVLRDLYTLTNDDKSTIGTVHSNSKTSATDSSIYEDDNDNIINESSKVSIRSHEDTILEDDVIQLCIDYLHIVWIQVSTVFDNEIELHELANSTENATRISTNTIPNHDIPAFKLFLESAIYVCGIVRCYSTNEICRKKLYILNFILLISNGLQTILNIYKKYKKINGNQFSVAMSTVINGKDFSVVMSQLGYIVVQLITILRNYSLDSNGRQQINEYKCFNYICEMTILYKYNNPELLLNCVRVMAKLSLYEVFRSVLNSNPKYIESLVNIILYESEMCYKVMNTTSSSSRNSLNWPSWHTWPALSRTAFTLGNLTTTNDTNRSVLE
jgi:hypothetical protein